MFKYRIHVNTLLLSQSEVSTNSGAQHLSAVKYLLYLTSYKAATYIKVNGLAMRFVHHLILSQHYFV